MPMVYIAVNDNGNVETASTTNPDLINYAPNDENIPDYQYEFDLSWEQIEELWKYKIADGNLILR